MEYKNMMSSSHGENCTAELENKTRPLTRFAVVSLLVCSYIVIKKILHEDKYFSRPIRCGRSQIDGYLFACVLMYNFCDPPVDLILLFLLRQAMKISFKIFNG
jgi:hypothetical protein